MRDDATDGDWLARASVLNWAVKDSFVRYVHGGGGSVTIVEPATVAAAGFEFPVAGQRGQFCVFAGGVVFVGHGGALTVAIAEPAIARTPGGLVLTIADVRTVDSDDARRPIAELRILELDDDHAVLSPSLTIAGSALFGLAYPEGLELDPLALSLARS